MHASIMRQRCGGRWRLTAACRSLRQLQRKLLLKSQEEHARWQKEWRWQEKRERMLKTLPIGAVLLIAAAGLVKHARTRK
jgi:hypothetical protein